MKKLAITVALSILFMGGFSFATSKCFSVSYSGEKGDIMYPNDNDGEKAYLPDVSSNYDNMWNPSTQLFTVPSDLGNEWFTLQYKADIIVEANNQNYPQTAYSNLFILNGPGNCDGESVTVSACAHPGESCATIQATCRVFMNYMESAALVLSCNSKDTAHCPSYRNVEFSGCLTG